MSEEGFTAEKFATWMPARTVFALATEAFGNQAASNILSHLHAGLIKARADHLILESNAKRTDFGFSKVIPVTIWKELDDSDHPSRLTLWNTNAVEVKVYPNGLSLAGLYKLFGIRFDPVGIQEMLPPEVISRALPTIPAGPPIARNAPLIAGGAKHAGGAPRKEFWDDLWLAMFERLWLTEWQPKNQEEVANAMLDWAAEQGHRLGATSVKVPARKLFSLTKK